MSDETLKKKLTNAMKDAMRSKDKDRLSTIRLALAALKQIEIDERIELDDARVLAVLDKMVKQRRESIRQYEDGNRQDLADIEKSEIVILQEFLPEPLSEEEISALIDKAIADTGAEGMRDMGKVMGALKSPMQGRADMGAVSGKIKAKLT